MEFDQKYFQKIKFDREEILRYWQSACRDLEIAEEDKFAEVRFSYGFQALIKAGIALIAHVGSMKVRSVLGHHVRILKKMRDLLDDDDIVVVGGAMRQKRNNDFYGGGQCIGEKEASDYLRFVKDVFEKVKSRIKGNCSVGTVY